MFFINISLCFLNTIVIPEYPSFCLISRIKTSILRCMNTATMQQQNTFLSFVEMIPCVRMIKFHVLTSYSMECYFSDDCFTSCVKILWFRWWKRTHYIFRGHPNPLRFLLLWHLSCLGILYILIPFECLLGQHLHKHSSSKHALVQNLCQ